jgi:hypothetical protein
MAKNPQINRSCEEEVLLIDPSDTDSEDEDIDVIAFNSLINEVDTDENLRDHLNTIPTDDTTNTEAAMKLVSIVSTAVEILETGVSGGSGCHYKPIKF